MGFFKPNVEKMRIRQDVDGLIKTLKHKDFEVRKNAIHALGEIGGTKALEALIRALDGEDRGIRLNAIKALGETEDERAMEPLLKRLHPYFATRGIYRGFVWEALDKIEAKTGKRVARSMLYFLVLRRDRKPSRTQLEKVLDHYGRKGVVMLGGLKTSTLPQELDGYVVTTSMLACKEHSIAIDSKKDGIVYSIDDVSGEKLGVCRIYVHA